MGRPCNGPECCSLTGQPIGYVLAPVGAVHFDRRPPRPLHLVRVSILDEMTEREMDDWSD